MDLTGRGEADYVVVRGGVGCRCLHSASSSRAAGSDPCSRMLREAASVLPCASHWHASFFTGSRLLHACLVALALPLSPLTL